ncbi:MAG: TadE/TadG family type IV pilus assembly protein [Fusicatenibacter sp.]|nr:TadE/TadG family type IV pilus assembly protein [Fusicatenibacter sp.]
MKKIQDRKVQASITVEAVLVVPLVLMVIFLLLSLIFYIHERIWYTCTAYEAALRGVSMGRTDSDYGKEETSLRLGEREEAYPLPGREIQKEVTASEKKIEVEISGSVLPVTGNLPLEYQVAVSAARRNPTQIIRRIRNVKALLEAK